MNVSVLAELERCGWLFQQVGHDEVKCKCPFHEDNQASCSINTTTGQFKCHAAGCGSAGDFVTFIAGMFKVSRRVVLEELNQRYGIEDEQVKPIEPTLVEAYHKAIWEAPTLLAELYKRGISDDSIRNYRLGVYQNRITIPVYNVNGVCVNVRKYLPGAPGADKMKNIAGHGKMRLYPIEQVKYETIVVCGGEIKAIAIAQRLNVQGIGAVCATAGEGNWSNDFNVHFKGKRSYICLDIDRAGRDGAVKLAAKLRTTSQFVGIVQLPLDPDKYPTGDVNDYFGLEHKSTTDFLTLLQETLEWRPVQIAEEASQEPISLHLSESIKSRFTGKRVTVSAVVNALDSTPYVIPKQIKCHCGRNEDFCHICPVYASTPDSEGFVELGISPESPSILDMVATHKKTLRDSIREGLRIPTCDSVEFKPLEYYNVEDVRLSPQLEISSRQADQIMQPALCIGHGLEANEQYKLIGRMYPHPKTQQSVLLISESKPIRDALSNYHPTDGELEPLKIFRPSEWTVVGLEERLTDIYTDLSANVTHIYKRQELHLAIDLAYHSPLLIDFDSSQVKGWVEILVLGDSSQGKSETTSKLMLHYGLGERVECKNASVAGLLGGLQQIGTRWFVTWGMIPTHDKRLIVLEELKGTSTEVIGHLTDMRSSGIAEIPKIEKRRTHARTRLIAISNPRSDQPVASYNFGIEAIKELIGGLEDVRRFDLAIIVSASQVPVSELNQLQRHRPKVEHRYTNALCRTNVLWAWTRTVDQVKFEEGTYESILEQATELTCHYSDLIPLVDRGSMRLKVARLSAALACRTFSTTQSLQEVLVRPCHVQFIGNLIDRLYSDRVFGYRDFSRAIQMAATLQNPAEVRTRILQVPFPRDFIDSVLHTNDIELRDICDWCGWDKGDAIQLLSFLVRRHALVRSGNAYRKNSQFIDLLKELGSSDDLKRLGRPDFLQEQF